MQKKKIWTVVLAGFLTAALAAGQGSLFAKDEAEGQPEQEQQGTTEVNNWGGGVRRMYLQNSAVQKN
ncbi:hypothetical protein [Anaerostipes sp.]|uniref:hypothetical protein n=1 Tax=Anaerostipes sp. TaxID=1872530 RepID=UPI0025C71A24|nr:hypothetical protein [Anaerostipes sp.]MBS7007988.1 hypothetical protein [Anaerostipes sp.]